MQTIKLFKQLASKKNKKSTTLLEVDVDHPEGVGRRLVDGVQGLQLVDDVVELVLLRVGEPHVDDERLADLPPRHQALVEELAHVLVVQVPANGFVYINC